MTHTIEEQVRVSPTQIAEGTGRPFEGLKQTFKGLRRFRAELCILAATLGYANLVLRWLYSDFVRGSFHFHDLTLITDFFTNALRHGRPFWITDYQINHFQIHFTPSLVLLIPAFAFFRSQFALIAIVATTIFVAIAIATREQLESLKQAGVPAYSRIALAASFFVLLAFNRYTLRCLQSAHFEPLFLLPAVLVLAAIRRGASLPRTLTACLLALGVRQDAGLFLFFLLVSCLLAPESWKFTNRGRTCLAAFSCVIYVLVATKVVLPFFGSNVSTREWSRWGPTWPAVFLAWAQHPDQVIASLRSSEFLPFQSEFLWLQVLNGAAWISNTLPSILFYTAGTLDKHLLAFYNASFILPGILLCLAFSQLYGVAFIQRLTRYSPYWRHGLGTLFSAVFAYAAAQVAFPSRPDNDHVLVVDSLHRTDVFTNKALKRLLQCEEVHSVAADFNAIVYIPLRFDKYLLRNAKKADVVVARRRDKRNLLFSPPPKALHRDLTTDGYRQLFTADGYDVYLAPRLKCM